MKRASLPAASASTESESAGGTSSIYQHKTDCISEEEVAEIVRESLAAREDPFGVGAKVHVVVTQSGFENWRPAEVTAKYGMTSAICTRWQQKENKRKTPRISQSGIPVLSCTKSHSVGKYSLINISVPHADPAELTVCSRNST